MIDNLDQIERDLNELVDSLQFDRPGTEESIGKGALALVSSRIQDRCRSEQAPGGSSWPENKEWAKKSKLKQGKPVGVLGDPSDDSMLSELNIDGKQTVEAFKASMSYGAGSAFAEKKAEWFSNGSEVQAEDTEPSGAKNQPPRPFYELDDSDEVALDGYFQQEFDAVVERKSGGP